MLENDLQTLGYECIQHAPRLYRLIRMGRDMLTPLEYLQPNATDSELPLREEICGRPQADGENTFIRASSGGGFRGQRESGRVRHDTDEVRFGSAYCIKVDEDNAVILDRRRLSSIASIAPNYKAESDRAK